MWREDAARAHRLAVESFSLDVGAGECVAVVGPNGAGKTSLLLALVGAAPFEGKIAIGSRLLESKSLEELRRTTGFVFAEPTDQLFSTTVREEVAFGPRLRGASPDEVAERVVQALSAVGLSGFEERAPRSLSLGEQRRLAVATILSYDASLVLLDEPTASLDPRARTAMLETIRHLTATVLIATHDLDAAIELGARVVLLSSGKLVADGPAERLLTDEALLGKAGLGLPIGVAAARRGSLS